MRVNFSLLADSQDNGASPRDVAAIVLQIVAMDRLMMYVAAGGSKRHTLGRSAAD